MSFYQPYNPVSSYGPVQPPAPRKGANQKGQGANFSGQPVVNRSTSGGVGHMPLPNLSGRSVVPQTGGPQSAQNNQSPLPTGMGMQGGLSLPVPNGGGGNGGGSGGPMGMPLGLPPGFTPGQIPTDMGKQMEMLQQMMAMVPPEQLDALMGTMSPQERMVMKAMMSPQGAGAMEQVGKLNELLYEMSGRPQDWAIAIPVSMAATFGLEQIVHPNSAFLKGLGKLTNVWGLRHANDFIQKNALDRFSNVNWVQELAETVDINTLERKYLTDAINSFPELAGNSGTTVTANRLQKEFVDDITSKVSGSGRFADLEEVFKRWKGSLKYQKRYARRLNGIQKQFQRADRLRGNMFKWIPGSQWLANQLERRNLARFNNMVDGSKIAQLSDDVERHVLGHLMDDAIILSKAPTTTEARKAIVRGSEYLDKALKSKQSQAFQTSMRSMSAWTNRIKGFLGNYRTTYNLAQANGMAKNPIGRGILTLTTTLRNVFTGDLISGGKTATELAEAANDSFLSRSGKALSKSLGMWSLISGLTILAPAIYAARKDENKDNRIGAFGHSFFGGMLGNFLGWELGKRVLSTPVKNLLGKHGVKTFAKMGIPLLKHIPWIKGWTLAGTIIELTAMFGVGALFQKAGERFSWALFGKPAHVLKEEEEAKALKDQENTLKEAEKASKMAQNDPNSLNNPAANAQLPGQNPTAAAALDPTNSAATGQQPPQQQQPRDMVVHQASRIPNIHLSMEQIRANPIAQQQAGYFDSVVSQLGIPKGPLDDFTNNPFGRI